MLAGHAPAAVADQRLHIDELLTGPASLITMFPGRSGCPAFAGSGGGCDFVVSCWAGGPDEGCGPACRCGLGVVPRSAIAVAVFVPRWGRSSSVEGVFCVVEPVMAAGAHEGEFVDVGLAFCRCVPWHEVMSFAA